MSVVEVTSPGRLYTERSLLRRAGAELRALIEYRELIGFLVRSWLKARANHRMFGFVWWVLDPLLLMGTYVLLVRIIFHRGTFNFPVYVFVSLIAFRFFSTSVGGAMGRTVGGQAVMKQVVFPKTVIPLAAVITQAFHYAFALLAVFAFAVAFHVYPAPIDVLMAPVFFVEFVFTLAIAYLFAAANIFVRDLQNIMTYVFRITFYLAPGLFALSRISPAHRKFFYINPMTPLFLSYHNIFLYHQLPPYQILLTLFIFSCILLVIAYLVFVKLEPLFNKVL